MYIIRKGIKSLKLVGQINLILFELNISCRFIASSCWIFARISFKIVTLSFLLGRIVTLSFLIGFKVSVLIFLFLLFFLVFLQFKDLGKWPTLLHAKHVFWNMVQLKLSNWQDLFLKLQFLHLFKWSFFKWTFSNLLPIASIRSFGLWVSTLFNAIDLNF